LGQLWDNYGSTMGQRKIGVKKMKKFTEMQ